MNTFPRNSRHQGHLISALAYRSRCAECHGVLIYACGDVIETLTCSTNPEHTGVIESADFRPIELSERDKSFIELREALEFAWTDPFLASAIKVRHEKAKSVLFGGDDE